MTELQSFLTAMEEYNDATQEARFVQVVWEAMRLKCLHIFGSGPGVMPRPDVLNNQADYLIVSASCYSFLPAFFWLLVLLDGFAGCETMPL